MGFTAEVAKLLVGDFTRWLNVPINSGIVGHARAQMATERLKGWLGDALRDMRQTWPYHRTRTYGTFVSPAAWPRFGYSSKEIQEVRPPSGFLGDLHSYVAHEQQSFKQVLNAREALLKRCEEARRVHERRDTEVGRTAIGTHAKVGNLLLVKDDIVLAREAVRIKIARES